MKVGILTLKLHGNYGGVLQCFALTRVITKLGHTPVCINREYRERSIRSRIVNFIKLLGLYGFFHKKKVDSNIKIAEFIAKHIPQTSIIDNHKSMMRVCKKYGLEAVIVGSDQVWRKSYADNYGYEYFLDFVPDSLIKLSYAASFGKSEWEYSKIQSSQIKKLLSRFRDISVREKNGKDILYKNLEINSHCVLDPTLLLTSLDYDKIVSNRLISGKYAFIYWLGSYEIIRDEVNKLNNEGYKIVNVRLSQKGQKCSIEDWLSYIKFADIVITDSFHGTVFSIIYKRQFHVYGNMRGGNERIISLLNALGIENKFSDKQEIIDYDLIDEKLSLFRSQSLSFLTHALLK